MENFVYSGYWFYPGESNKRVPGTLTYDVSNNIRLVLDTALRAKEGIGLELNIAIILGELSNGDLITLYNVIPIKVEVIDSSLRVASANIIIKGLHFNSESDLVFNKMTATYNTLDAFLHSSGGFKADFFSYFKTGIIDIQYKSPKPIVIEINDTFSAEIVSLPKWEYNSKKCHVTESSTFYISAKDKLLTLEEFFEYSACFHLFLSMATGQTTYATSLKLQTGNGHEVDIFYNTPHAGTVVEFDECYFKFPLIKDEFDSVIKTWFNSYKQLKPVVELFLSHSYSTDKRFSSMYFVNIVNALESFHIRFIEDLAKAKRDRPPLAIRLKELIEKYTTDTFSLYVKDPNEFIEKTKKSRNYYTHYDPVAEADALKFGALHAYYERLKILLLTALLVQSGLSIALVEKIHSQNRSLRP